MDNRKKKMIKRFCELFDFVMTTPSNHAIQENLEINRILASLWFDYDITLEQLLDIKEKRQ